MRELADVPRDNNPVPVEPMTKSINVDQFDSFLSAYAEARRLSKEWDASAKQIRGAIETVLATEEGREVFGTVEGRRRCKLTTYEHEQFDIEKFRESYPELYQGFCRKVERRRFTVY